MNIFHGLIGSKAGEEAKIAARKAFREAAWKTFLSYHENSDWSRAVAERDRAPLTPEAVAYMQREIDVRAARKEAYETWEKEQHAKQPTEIPASEAAVQRDSGSAVVGGAEQPGSENG